MPDLIPDYRHLIELLRRCAEDYRKRGLRRCRRACLRRVVVYEARLTGGHDVKR